MVQCGRGAIRNVYDSLNGAENLPDKINECIGIMFTTRPKWALGWWRDDCHDFLNKRKFVSSVNVLNIILFVLIKLTLVTF